MNIILYKGQQCPKCKVIALKLDKKNIKYEVIDNMQQILAAGVKTIPTLEVDGVRYSDIKACNDWINAQEE